MNRRELRHRLEELTDALGRSADGGHLPPQEQRLIGGLLRHLHSALDAIRLPRRRRELKTALKNALDAARGLAQLSSAGAEAASVIEGLLAGCRPARGRRKRPSGRKRIAPPPAVPVRERVTTPAKLSELSVVLATGRWRIELGGLGMQGLLRLLEVLS